MSCRNHDAESEKNLAQDEGFRTRFKCSECGEWYQKKGYDNYPKQAGRNHMKEFIDGFKENNSANLGRDSPGPGNTELQGVQEHKL